MANRYIGSTLMVAGLGIRGAPTWCGGLRLFLVLAEEPLIYATDSWMAGGVASSSMASVMGQGLKPLTIR